MNTATNISFWTGATTTSGVGIKRLEVDTLGNFNFNLNDVYFENSSGNVGIGITSPVISGTGKLHMAADTFRLDTARTPASAGATGNPGEICWDADYLYICSAANSWKRTPLATW